MVNQPNQKTQTNSVDVANGRRGEIIVNNEIDSLKVDTATHQLSTDENPNLTRAETFNNIVALKLSPFRMNDVDVDSVVDQFRIEFFSPLFSLDKN